MDVARRAIGDGSHGHFGLFAFKIEKMEPFAGGLVEWKVGWWPVLVHWATWTPTWFHDGLIVCAKQFHSPTVSAVAVPCFLSGSNFNCESLWVRTGLAMFALESDRQCGSPIPWPNETTWRGRE